MPRVVALNIAIVVAFKFFRLLKSENKTYCSQIPRGPSRQKVGAGGMRAHDTVTHVGSFDRFEDYLVSQFYPICTTHVAHFLKNEHQESSAHPYLSMRSCGRPKWMARALSKGAICNLRTLLAFPAVRMYLTLECNFSSLIAKKRRAKYVSYSSIFLLMTASITARL